MKSPNNICLADSCSPRRIGFEMEKLQKLVQKLTSRDAKNSTTAKGLSTNAKWVSNPVVMQDVIESNKEFWVRERTFQTFDHTFLVAETQTAVEAYPEEEEQSGRLYKSAAKLPISNQHLGTSSYCSLGEFGCLSQILIQSLKEQYGASVRQKHAGGMWRSQSIRPFSHSDRKLAFKQHN